MDKKFPIQAGGSLMGGSISWPVAELLYAEYAKQFGHSQSLERLAQRGGFGWGEVGLFAPAAITALQTTLAAREAEVGRLREALVEFGDHDLKCDYCDTFLLPQPKPCNCGLAAALADHTP